MMASINPFRQASGPAREVDGRSLPCSIGIEVILVPRCSSLFRGEKCFPTLNTIMLGIVAVREQEYSRGRCFTFLAAESPAVTRLGCMRTTTAFTVDVGPRASLFTQSPIAAGGKLFLRVSAPSSYLRNLRMSAM
jgi:hypothetical protein